MSEIPVFTYGEKSIFTFSGGATHTIAHKCVQQATSERSYTKDVGAVNPSHVRALARSGHQSDCKNWRKVGVKKCPKKCLKVVPEIHVSKVHFFVTKSDEKK